MRMRFARRRAKKAGRSPDGQAAGMPRDDQADWSGQAPAGRIVNGQPEGGYTSTSEIICCYCGDHPDRDYREVPPGLQRIRRRYPIAAGVEAYVKHLKRHPS